MPTSPDVDVIFVTVLDLTSPDGSGVATKEIIKAFCRNEKSNVTLICPRGQRELADEITDNVRQLEYLPPRSDPGSPLWHGKEQLILFKRLFSAIREVDPDVIVSRMGSSLISPPALAAIFGIPYIPLVRGRVVRKDDYEETKLAHLVELIFRFNLRVGDHTFVPIGEIKDTIHEIDSSFPVEVFPNAVDPELFRPVSMDQARERIEYGLEPDDFVVGFVGALSGRHRIGELIRGFANAFPSESRAKLLIVGGGDIDEVRRVARNEGVQSRVLFTGSIAHERVPVFVSGCDVLYGISDPDVPTAPIKLYEYLACERPVITTEQPELAFVGERDLGYVLPELSVEAISEALRAAESEADTALQERGQRGRDYVKRNHTWDRIPELVLDRLAANGKI